MTASTKRREHHASHTPEDGVHYVSFYLRGSMATQLLGSMFRTHGHHQITIYSENVSSYSIQPSVSSGVISK